MPLYNEETITESKSKTRYEYAYNIELQNHLGKPPKVVFKTGTAERNNDTGEETLLSFKRTLEEVYSGNEVFDVVDLDGNVVGQADYDTLFGLLYSLFFHVAAKTGTGA